MRRYQTPQQIAGTAAANLCTVTEQLDYIEAHRDYWQSVYVWATHGCVDAAPTIRDTAFARREAAARRRRHKSLLEDLKPRLGGETA